MNPFKYVKDDFGFRPENSNELDSAAWLLLDLCGRQYEEDPTSPAIGPDGPPAANNYAEVFRRLARYSDTAFFRHLRAKLNDRVEGGRE